MGDISKFFSGGGFVPKSIVNYSSSGTLTRKSATSSVNGLYPGYTSAKIYSVGACTANTLKTILSVSGKGAISFCALNEGDTVARTERVKITLDGVVIFDATTAGSAVNYAACEIIGSIVPAWNGTYNLYSGICETPLQFNTSLLVEFASSLSETPNCNLAIIHYTR